MQLVYLFKGLEHAADAVVMIVNRVPEERWDQQLDPERFSFREAVSHHADWETINLERLRRGVESPGCTVQGFDEGQRAIDHGYSSLNPRDQARLFAERRRATLAYLHSLTDEDWVKVYFHSERGQQTVLEQAIAILGHDMYHVEGFAQYL